MLRTRARAAARIFSLLTGAWLVTVPGPAFAGMGMGSIDSADLLSNIDGANPLQNDIGFFLGGTCDGLAAIGIDKSGGGEAADLFIECSRIVAAALDIADGLDNIDGFDVDDLLTALLAVGHDESTAQGRLAIGAMGAAIGSINQRMVALREGSTGIQIAGLRFVDDEGNVFDGERMEGVLNEFAAKAQAGTPLGEKVGIFLNGLGSWGNYDGNNQEADFDTRSWGLIGGADYRINDNLVTGVAVGFSRTDDKFQRDTGRLKSDVWTGSLFGSYSRDSWFVDGIFSLSGIDYELRRDLRFPTLKRVAKGDTNGLMMGFAASAGYDFKIDAFTVGPRARIEYIRTTIGSFEERNAGGLNLDFQSQNVRSLKTALGLDASYAISTGFGIVSPYVRAEYEHEWEDDSRDITVSFVADPNNSLLRLRTQSPDRNVVNLGAGVTAALPGGVAAFADFETVLFSKLWENYRFTVGGRYAF